MQYKETCAWYLAAKFKKKEKKQCEISSFKVVF